MDDWFLEKLENSKQEAEKQIEKQKTAIERLEEEIRLNEDMRNAEDYQEDMTEAQLKGLKYETMALGDIKTWHESKLEEAEQKKEILECKIRYRRHRIGK